MIREISILKDILKVQSADGNWDFDEYGYGIYVGLEMSLAVIENRDPKFKNRPICWLKDKKKKIDMILKE